MIDEALKFRISQIQRIFNIDDYLTRLSANKQEIAKYYRLNRLAYKFVNSREGFVHMGISADGVFNKGDFYEHARIISHYIDKNKASTILELAAGKAATTTYLANTFKNVSFTGMDLPNGQLAIQKAHPANLVLDEGDYHDLSTYKAESFDIVYIVEALCHANDKEQVIQEVARILKPKGLFIIFDGYLSKPFSEMTETEKLSSDLIYSSMMVTTKGHNYADLLGYLQKNKFVIQEERNLSDNILPSIRRLEKKAKKFLKHPLLARFINKHIPEEITGNAIAAYLMPVTVQSGLHQYWLTMARKA